MRISAGIDATPVLAMLHVLTDTGSASSAGSATRRRNGAEEPFAAESCRCWQGWPAGPYRHVSALLYLVAVPG